MLVKLLDGFVIAEGSEHECAIYTFALLEMFKMKNEQDKQKEAEEWLKKHGGMRFEDFIRTEREDEG